MKINNNFSQYNIDNSRQIAKNEQTKDFKKILESAQNSSDDEKLRSTCKQFESIFVNMLMENMRRTVGDGGLVEKSQAREIFEGMLDEEIAKEVSRGEGIGLAKMMYAQLSKHIDSNGNNEE